MPYKLSKDKKAVMVQRGNRWVTKKRYTGKDAKSKALAYLRALKVNTGH